MHVRKEKILVFVNLISFYQKSIIRFKKILVLDPFSDLFL